MPYPPKDGGAIATLNLATGLADLSNSVDILAINTLKHYFDIKQIPDEIQKKVTFYDHFCDTTLKTTRLIKNFLFSKIPYNAERFILKDFEEKIIDLLRSKQYNIIQLEGLYVLPYISIIRKYSKALISYRAHNVEHLIWQRTSRFTKNPHKKLYLKNLAYRIKRFERKYINKYDLLIPITTIDAQILSKMGNNRPSLVVPVAFDINKIPKPEHNFEFPTLFFIGSLDWTPNQEGLMWFLNKCWDTIQLKHPNLKFYIAGRNAPEWLQKIFEKKNIVYLGEILDAHKYMNSKAIMLAPLFSGSGIRVKIIEGMALGKTIITTSVGAEGIDVEDNHNILIANNSEKFIEAIDKLVDNKELVENIGHNAHNFVKEHFNIATISMNLLNFYKKNLK